MENTPERHIDRVKQHLTNGRRLIESLHERQEPLETYDMPDTLGPDYGMYSRGPPLAGDWLVHSVLPSYTTTQKKNSKVLCRDRRTQRHRSTTVSQPGSCFHG